MSRTQIYKPAARWPIFAALFGALTIEFTALAVASFKKEVIPVVTGLTSPHPIDRTNGHAALKNLSSRGRRSAPRDLTDALKGNYRSMDAEDLSVGSLAVCAGSG